MSLEEIFEIPKITCEIRKRCKQLSEWFAEIEGETKDVRINRNKFILIHEFDALRNKHGRMMAEFLNKLKEFIVLQHEKHGDYTLQDLEIEFRRNKVSAFLVACPFDSEAGANQNPRIECKLHGEPKEFELQIIFAENLQDYFRQFVQLVGNPENKQLGDLINMNMVNLKNTGIINVIDDDD